MVGIVVPWRTFESAERYGRLVADCAADVHGCAPARDLVRAGVGRRRGVELRAQALPDPRRRAPPDQADRAERGASGRPRCRRDAHVPRRSPRPPMPISSPVQAADPAQRGPVRLRVSALGIGPLVHLGVQGELFVALGQPIREPPRADDRTCIAALCDGTVGYIPTADAFEEGGYEPNASVLRAGEGEAPCRRHRRSRRRAGPTGALSQSR